jgi:asparagine synthase (glutamine-hydrolysing)
MCGICGIARYGSTVDPTEIERMKEVLRHRGPDDDGTYLTSLHMPAETLFVGLGHRRLSIIDLSPDGKQPMSNEDGRIRLTYNGEIYNFRELRGELEQHGHVFASNTDSEVIIHAYEQWGTECLGRFNGMFAFAIWDERDGSLFLARDRIGIKPLYYYCDGDMLVFASELKALLEVRDVPRQPDYQSLSDYLSWQFVPGPATIFKNVRKLPAAHFAVFRDKTLTCRRYWNVRDYSDSLEGEDIGSIQERIRNILGDSVRKRLISDVPLGAFLSGGFDSSTVVALMSKLCGKPVQTFSIGFDSEEYTSELHYARMVAEQCGTDHHERILSSDRLVAMLDRLVWHMDEPFADHSMVPTFLVSQTAREHITVALSGDGADENFAGYPRRYRFAARYDAYLAWPKLMRDMFEGASLGVVGGMLSVLPENTLRKRLLKLNDVLRSSGLMRIVNLDSVVGTSLKKLMLSDSVKATVSLQPQIRTVDCTGSGGSLTDEVLLLDAENYLVDDILTKVDRMSMANSLEVRVPMLDHRLVELAAGIPAKIKMQHNRPKYLLKDTFREIVPEPVINREKQGFGIPLKLWMRNDITEYTRQVLLDDRFRSRGIFESKQVEKMIHATADGKCSYSGELWAVLVFELWCRRFLDASRE